MGFRVMGLWFRGTTVWGAGTYYLIPHRKGAQYSAIFMFLNFVTITIITPHPRGAQKPVGNDAGCKFKNVTFII